MKPFTTSAALACIVALSMGLTHASSVVSQGFSGASLSVSTTGALGWGYVNNLNGMFSGAYSDLSYGSLDTVGDGTGTVITTVSSAPTIGAVTVTEGNNGTNVIDPKATTVVIYSFDGLSAYGVYGNMAAGEDNVWSVTFNDLGVGSRTITLFMGHSSDTRSFQMDYSLDGGAFVNGTVANDGISGAISALGGAAASRAFRYDITVDSTAASTDLTLRFGSQSGSAGEGYWAGYIVTGVVPEPSMALLSSLGALLLLHRRR